MGWIKPKKISRFCPLEWWLKLSIYVKHSTASFVYIQDNSCIGLINWLIGHKQGKDGSQQLISA